MVQRLWLAVLVVFAGACFSPEFRDGAITCGTRGECPPGLECHNNLCRAPGFPQGDSLTVSKVGLGNGTVTSDVSGIDCGTDCSESYNHDTVVTLTAVATTGSTFDGWAGGGCTGVGTCVVTIQTDMPINVTATFTLTTHTLTVVPAGNGSGTVTSSPAGINCTDGASDCSASYNYGTEVTLTATPATGSTFASWSGGGCSGTGTCIVDVTTATSVTATYTLNIHTLSVFKAGMGSTGGRVVANVGMLDCGNRCDENYGYGTAVTLTATTEPGSMFTSWSDACSGMQSTCTLSMTSDLQATANFEMVTNLLTAEISPAGSGTIAALNPSGIIACPGDCTETVAYGTMVTLQATASPGYEFTSWSGGGCDGNTGDCVTTVTAATTVTANFVVATYLLTVDRGGKGAALGSVTSDPVGIACDSGQEDCTEIYEHGQSVVLTATTLTGAVFDGWSDCLGLGPCTVSMTRAHNVTASFSLTTHTLSVTTAGTGTGEVTSSPSGITCPNDCDHVYDYGTDVILTATPSYGSTFGGWPAGSGCAGTTPCTVNVKAATSIAVTFDRTPPNYVFVTSTTTTGAITTLANGTTLVGLAAADAICNARAAANPSIPQGGYVAYLSTDNGGTGNPARGRLGNASGWVRTDGRPVFNTVSDIAAGHMFYPIQFDESGTTTISDNSIMITGSNGAGQYHGNGDCGGYTTTQGPIAFGGPASSNSNLFSFTGETSCATPDMRFYCFGTTNQAIVAPATGTFRRVFTTTGTFTPQVNGIAAADALCSSEAMQAGYNNATFRALLATNGASALSRFINVTNAFRPWARPDNTLMVANTEDLAVTTQLLAAPNSNVQNTEWYGFDPLRPNESIFYSGATNLTTAGTTATTCNNWTDTSAVATVGHAALTTVSQWFGYGSSNSCSVARKIVCMQD